MIVTRDTQGQPRVWINPAKIQQFFEFGPSTLIVFGPGEDDCIRVAESFEDILRAIEGGRVEDL